MPGYPIISAQRGPEPIARRMPFWELPTPALADRGIVLVSGMANVSCEERFRGARPHLHAQESLWAEYENTPSAGSPDGDPIARGRRPRKNRHAILYFRASPHIVGSMADTPARRAPVEFSSRARCRRPTGKRGENDELDELYEFAHGNHELVTARIATASFIAEPLFASHAPDACLISRRLTKNGGLTETETEHARISGCPAR